ncbi:MAG: ABC transporter ATP-binding protein, partial [Chryseobacterium sp.]
FDEPTNYLDLTTITLLENFLKQFQGSLIIVSHDRYFMDRIVDHILAFEGDGKIKDFIGNFSEYRESKSREESMEKSTAQKQEVIKENIPAAINNPFTAKKKRLSFKEQRELETIEKEMPELEEQRAKILDHLNNESDYEKISKLSGDLENISEKLENHEMRWLELQEILGEG